MKNLFLTPITLVICCLLMCCSQRNAEQQEQDLQRHDDSLKASIEAEMNGKLQLQNDSLKALLSEKDNSGTTVKVQNNQKNSQTENGVTMSQVADLMQKQNVYNNCKVAIQKLNNLLVNTKASLEYEQSQLTEVEKFHIGRSNVERAQQIRNQSLRVQAYQDKVQQIQETILKITNKMYAIKEDISQSSR
jgi:hypothetical protein